MKRIFALLVLALATLGLTGCGYNTLQTTDEQTKSAWSEVVNQYQRRADLIPNLVETVKGFAKQEQEVLNNIANARAGLLNARNPQEAIQANSRLDSALGRLLVVVENYQQLRSNENFLRLQDELAGTENRIAVSRTDYNNSVNEYNSYIRRFPAVLTAKVLGSKPREYFEVSDAAKREAPTVDFNATPAVTPSAAMMGGAQHATQAAATNPPRAAASRVFTVRSRRARR